MHNEVSNEYYLAFLFVPFLVINIIEYTLLIPILENPLIDSTIVQPVNCMNEWNEQINPSFVDLLGQEVNTKR